MTDAEGQRWAVIGGGILGMTLALRLAQRGHTVTLIEKRDHLGGLATAWSLGDVVWDRHYHVTLMSDSYTRAILSELGLDDDMQWVTTRTGFFTDGRLHSMSSSLEYLLFRPLGLIAKARLAGTIFHASRIQDWRQLEQIQVVRLAPQLLREENLREDLAAAAAFQARRRLRANLGGVHLGDHPTHVRRQTIGHEAGVSSGYLPGGYARILDTFTASTPTTLDVHLFLGMDVCAVASEPTGEVRVEMKGGTRIRFDRVVLTTPAPITPTTVPGPVAGRTEPPRGCRVPGHRVLVHAPQKAPGRLLRHQHHRLVGALHRRHRDVGVRRPRPVWRELARLPPPVRGQRRPGLRDARSRVGGAGGRDPLKNVPSLRPRRRARVSSVARTIRLRPSHPGILGADSAPAHIAPGHFHCQLRPDSQRHAERERNRQACRGRHRGPRRPTPPIRSPWAGSHESLG